MENQRQWCSRKKEIRAELFINCWADSKVSNAGTKGIIPGSRTELLGRRSVIVILVGVQITTVDFS